ncbi:hypothetical protein GJA_3149 [Janthinobacterium agaricidamnosum NBRC 102515 = DSM 9628]|uniref:DUF2235 domain-containing protein n=1 Tax=Janthinobacterium agaricidamnosum NBRC 102515 = DSM 9628 TaxID=1349767 RepID=W0V7B1_9BURK|nr:hypothetical protein GJA_3149 [Janthinobacterium agaricidamnosum NBRC 102515 = DSM 9628]
MSRHVRSPNSACQGQIYIGLFYDGSGNNQDWKEQYLVAKRKPVFYAEAEKRLFRNILKPKPSGKSS